MYLCIFDNHSKIFVKGKLLEVVYSFIYVGSSVQNDANLNAEIYLRIQGALQALGGLGSRSWRRRHINNNTKLDIFKDRLYYRTYYIFLKHGCVMKGISKC